MYQMGDLLKFLCCKHELMPVCLCVFTGSWMSVITLLYNLIWPADHGELFITLQCLVCCVPFVNLIHRQLCKWHSWQNNLISSWRCLENLMRKIMKEWIFMYNVHIWFKHRNWMYRRQVLLFRNQERTNKGWAGGWTSRTRVQVST